MSESYIKIRNIMKRGLSRMRQIRGGQSTSETSLYGPLESMLNEIYEELGLDAICNSQPGTGSMHPDYGVFRKSTCDSELASGSGPEFAVIEMKGPSEDVRKVAKEKQVRKYLSKHGVVVISNYREFLLIVEDKDGKQHERDFFSLADSEDEFWKLTSRPRNVSTEGAKRLAGFLRQILMERIRISDPKEVARNLALFAKKTLERLKDEGNGSLQELHETLEQGIGAKFEGKDAKDVFRSTLVQTIFYGLFSAWVRDGKDGEFRWDNAKYDIPVPVIQTLFEQLTMIDKMERLGLQEILDIAIRDLNRIDRDKFLKAFKEDESAIQHFYELFLSEFDSDVRISLGVWYTPKEIVKYMVERVDQVLRTEMGYADGLADKSVYILDPCCGTGAYVMEVLRKIKDIHVRKGDNEKVAAGHVKRAAIERVAGFEIMTAPLMIAHWQISDYLEEIGAALDHKKNEIPKICLTDSLIEWDEGEQPKLPLPGLANERARARKVKQEDSVLVIIGNPPYYSKSKPTAEKLELVERYSRNLIPVWRIKKNTLKDSYVQFFSAAEKYIVEKRERGVVCFISNYSYVEREGFVEMRKHLLDGFNGIWIDSLNGSLTENRMMTPDGGKDDSVFETKYNPNGISTGVAIGLFVKKSMSEKEAVVRYRNFWGLANEKRERLLESLDSDPESFDVQYEITEPSKWNLFRFSKSKKNDVYLSWPAIADLRKNVPGLQKPASYITGVVERRGKALIDIDEDALRERMQTYFNKGLGWNDFHKRGHALVGDWGRYDARKVRTKALESESFDEDNIVPHIFKPFDIRSAYHARTPGIWSCKQDAFRIHMAYGDGFVATRHQKGCNNEGFPVFFTRCLGGDDTARGHSKYFPLITREAKEEADGRAVLSGLFDTNSHKPEDLKTTPGLDRWFEDLQLREVFPKDQLEEIPLLHSLAIAWSPMYLRDNKMSLEIGWPRVPLPANGALAIESAELGRDVAALLDVPNPKGVVGITAGNIAKHLRVIGDVVGEDFRLVSGKPRKARKQSNSEKWSDPERKMLEAGFKSIGIEVRRGFDLLGPPLDVELNDSTYWSGVPKSVWECVIGGNQPVKNWIATRRNFLRTNSRRAEGGVLEPEEVEESYEIMRRIAALILMGDRLDVNYAACRDNAWKWIGGDS